MVVVVVDSSRQPNQPGVLHVDVDFDEVLLEVEVVVRESVVVDSSRQPNQPGVLHVSVRVRLEVVVVVGMTTVVVVSVPLLSKNSHG